MHIRFSKFVLFFFALLLAGGAALAQSRVTGTVKDSSGAVVPGVEVIVRNVETGQVTSAQSNQSGVYSISFLNPGQYEIACELAGFKKFVRAGIVLETGTTSTVDVTLNVGQISDVVNVTASAPLLESESGALGQLVENKMILNMPIREPARGRAGAADGQRHVQRRETAGSPFPSSPWPAGVPITRCGTWTAAWRRTSPTAARSFR